MDTSKVINTQHLILRPIESTDLDTLYELYRNPEVMRYIYDGHPFSKEASITKVNDCVQHWKTYGFGVWVIIEKSSDKMAGYCVLRHFDENENQPDLMNPIELGYILDKPFWGKGYASEAVQACIKIGFERYKFNRIVATILPENIGSQKVVLKAGMIHTHNLIIKNLDHKIYEITRDQYLKTSHSH